MPHIHTKEGEIDFTADVFVVHKNRVLLRMHDKYRMWLMVGGHIETHETPEETAVREAKEEVGLDITIWSGDQETVPESFLNSQFRSLVPPIFLNVHKISDTHRHISMIYFAFSDSDVIIEPETHEKSGGCVWFSKEELLADKDIDAPIKYYALKALEVLGS